MAKNTDSSIKLLVLYDILLKSTDEEDALSTNEIIEELTKRGISVSRKFIRSRTATAERDGLYASKNGCDLILYHLLSKIAKSV